MFDGSSIAGWKAINESDMTLMPDPTSACMDPFFAAATMSIVCDVLEPATGEPYNRDPRGIAKKAEAFAKSAGVGDAVYFGPEAEFFVFDDVRFKSDPYNTGFVLDSIELPSNMDTSYEGGNLGHRVRTKGGYFPVPPIDSAQDMRGEMLAAMAQMGARVEKHHHEVASAQHELGLKFGPLTTMADHMQVYKYCIHQVAAELRQVGDVHAEARLWRQRLRHARPPVDLEGWQARVRGRQICWAFRRNASGTSAASSATPSHSTPSPIRRPTATSGWCRATRRRCCWLTSARNRSASCRIPFTSNPKAKRVEVRFPDPAANPYLAFSAMLMAGLDGIANKIDPGQAMDTGSLRSATARVGRRFRRCAARFAKRSRTCRRTGSI